jgi:hypothetical protein
MPERFRPCLPRSTGERPATSPPSGALVMAPSTAVWSRTRPTTRSHRSIRLRPSPYRIRPGTGRLPATPAAGPAPPRAAAPAVPSLSADPQDRPAAEAARAPGPQSRPSERSDPGRTLGCRPEPGIGTAAARTNTNAGEYTPTPPRSTGGKPQAPVLPCLIGWQYWPPRKGASSCQGVHTWRLRARCRSRP